MGDIVKALVAASRGMLHPRMLALVLWPMLGALGLWLLLAYFYWDAWSHWLVGIVDQSILNAWLSQRTLDLLAHYSALLLLALLLAPAIFLTAVLIAALVEMSLIVRFVAETYFPGLEMRRGGTAVGSIVNAAAAVMVFLVLWVVTLPLWLTGVLAPVLPVVLSAYLNQRLFRYDALSEHASKEEYRQIKASCWGRMYILGALLAMLYFVPLLNFVVPVLSGLAYTHFCLTQLARLRHMQGPGGLRLT